MGIAVSTLRNMADPKQETHGWSLKRFRQLIAFAGPRPLHALCAEHGGVFVPTTRLADVELPQLYEMVTKLAATFGAIPLAIETAMKDNRITPREMTKLDSQIFELIETAAELRRRLQIESTHPALRAAAK
jgi:hypothetical protein